MVDCVLFGDVQLYIDACEVLESEEEVADPFSFRPKWERNISWYIFCSISFFVTFFSLYHFILILSPSRHNGDDGGGGDGNDDGDGDDNDDDECRGDRYDAVRVCLGENTLQKLANLKLFMVMSCCYCCCCLLMYLNCHVVL